MSKYLLAVVAAGCVAAAASAQPITGVAGPGCTNCGSGGAAPPAPVYPQAYAPDAGYAMPSMPAMAAGKCRECDPRFGLAPFLRKLAFWKKGGCGTCGGGLKGCAGGNCAGQPVGGHGGFNPYPNGVPGTLVFPYNPYIRSPRDWFMQDK
jgi:hypothetical protein